MNHAPTPLLPEEEHALLLQLPGNPEAFRKLYRHYFPRVFAYAAYRLGTKQDAEDVTSTIFVKVIQALDQFEYRGANAFATWLFRIAYHEVQQNYRTGFRRPVVALDEIPEIPSTELLPDEAYSRKEQFLRLRQALLLLAPRRQEVITLRFFAGLRNHEIAAVLALDERTVASHLCRGLEDLKQIYQREAAANE